MLAAAPAGAATVKSVEYKSTSSGGEVIIKADGKIDYDSESNEQDRQIVVNLKQAELSPAATKTIDASAQEGPVLQVSTYKVEGDEKQARVVIQLWENSVPNVTRQGNTIRVRISKASAAAGAETKPAGEGDQSGSRQAEAAPEQSEDQKKKDVGLQNLEMYMANVQTKRFTGRPVTIQVRDAELGDVLRMIAEASGFNILVGDQIGGKITLSLVDVPWDQALEVILSSKRLGAERRNNILRIATLANMAAEKEEELRAKQATEKAAPRITRIFPISFAEAPALQTLLQNFSNSLVGMVAGGGPIGGGMAGPQAGAASIQIDQRTNSLIVQDTAVGLERIAKLITLLDVETPQVLIEAKIIEASEQFSKDFSGQLGFQRINNDSRGLFGSFAGGYTNTGLTGVSPPSGTPARNSSFGYSPSMAFLPNLQRLNAILSIDESNSETRVLASPKTVVLNKKKASIVQQTPVAIPETVNAAGAVTTTYKINQASLSLDVTPVVTNTGSVLLTLDLSRDTIESTQAGAAVAPRSMKTEVLVDSGSTLVIGGIYTSSKNKSDYGFPFLKDIPFLGVLFGGKSASEKKTELLIFVTPRIVNEKRSSMAEGNGGGEPSSRPAG